MEVSWLVPHFEGFLPETAGLRQRMTTKRCFEVISSPSVTGSDILQTIAGIREEEK